MPRKQRKIEETAFFFLFFFSFFPDKELSLRKRYIVVLGRVVTNDNESKI